MCIIKLLIINETQCRIEIIDNELITVSCEHVSAKFRACGCVANAL